MTDADADRDCSMAALDRVTLLAAFRLLASGQHPDLLSVDAVERFPVEPPDGAVLRFTKTWGGPRAYTYAALRVGDHWYTTSTKGHQQKMTWLELAELIQDNPCSIATDWADIPTPEPSPFADMTPAEWHAHMWPKGATVEGKAGDAPPPPNNGGNHAERPASRVQVRQGVRGQRRPVG